MRRLFIASLAALACGAAAPAPQAKPQPPLSQAERDQARLAKVLTGLTPGKPISCISQFRPTYNTETVGDDILYTFNRRQIYRNQTTGGCRNSINDTLVVVNFGSQLCRGQIIRTIDRFTGIETGSCALGDFVPYTKAK